MPNPLTGLTQIKSTDITDGSITNAKISPSPSIPGTKVNVDLGNFINKLTSNKLLTIRAAENVVRILPPLNVKKREIDQALKILNKVCSEY